MLVHTFLAVLGKSLVGTAAAPLANSFVGQLIVVATAEVLDLWKQRGSTASSLQGLPQNVLGAVESIQEKLEVHISREFRGLSDADKSSVKLAVAETILSARNIPEDLLSLDLNAEQLSKYLEGFCPAYFDRNFGLDSKALHSLLLKEIAEYVCKLCLSDP